MSVQDSEPAQAEGERKVKRGIALMLSEVPRVHLLTILRQVAPEARSPSDRRLDTPTSAERFRQTLKRIGASSGQRL